MSTILNYFIIICVFVVFFFWGKRIYTKGIKSSYTSIPLFLILFSLFLWVIFPRDYTKKRIALIERTLQIDLPPNSLISNYEYDQPEFLITDYTASFEVKLSAKGLKDIRMQIQKVPFYNQLHLFEKKIFQGDEIKIADSIRQVMHNSKYRGSWIETAKGIKYIDFEIMSTNTAVNALIDIDKQILYYEFTDW